MESLPQLEYPMNSLESTATSDPSSTWLVNGISRAFIVAYKESTQLLENALTAEGIDCQVLRQEHQAQWEGFSPSYLCMLNHKQAWEQAMTESKPTLIVEADFVPVLEFGRCPLPFHPQEQNVGIAWLYTCASQVYSVSSDGYAEGFSTSMVAYIITAKSAKHLIELAEEVREKNGPTTYSSWDSTVDNFLRARGLKNYIPFRNYGEHGGLPNLEHRKHGLSKVHRADVLYRKLAFLPLYAKNSQANFIQERLKARLKGIARLAVGKFLRLPIIKGSSTPGRLLSFAIGRQFSLFARIPLIPQNKSKVKIKNQ